MSDRQVITRNSITRDHRFQPRDHLDKKLVEDYVRNYDEGLDLPPLEVMRINDVLVLIDGFHRLVALERLDREFVTVVVTDASEADAFKRAAKVNAEHGARRSGKDKIAQIRLAFRYLDAVDEETFSREYRHRVSPSPTPRKDVIVDGWTHNDIATLVGISLDDVRKNRDAALTELDIKSSVLSRESGYEARRRAAQREAAAQRKAARERAAAAAKEEATAEEVAELGAEREEEREALEAAAAQAADEEAVSEVPMPLFHDNYIGKDLFGGGRKMMEGLLVWSALKKEYGEPRLRMYILESEQLQSDLRFWRDNVAFVLGELDAILAGLEEVQHVAQ